ncbi:TolB family protein [Aeromicrobium sp. UC242_57]|uniref:TolB family protein n=1 Tax=Aeromicrobium sp. UC242_57 TaxID=3374624 RepID=UPI003789C81D
MKAADLGLLRLPGSPTLSPDRRHAAVSLKRADLGDDRYYADLWLAAVDGSTPPVAITSGGLDTDPVWSPDGRQLAFLRLDPESGPQLHVVPADGGEPRRVTSHPLGVAEPRWSPDSGSIAYIARVPDKGRYVHPVLLTAASEPPRRITTLRYRADGLGYTNDRRKHVFVVDLADGGITQLTSGDADHQHVAWSPDGTRLAFASARHADRDSVPARDVFVMTLADRATQQVTTTSLRAGQPAFSASGDRLYFLGAAIGGPLERDVLQPDGPVGRRALRRSASPTADLRRDGRPGRTSGRACAGSGQRWGAHDDRTPRCGRPGSSRRPGEIVDVLAGPGQVIGFAAVDDTIVAAVADDTSAGELEGPDRRRREDADFIRCRALVGNVGAADAGDLGSGP